MSKTYAQIGLSCVLVVPLNITKCCCLQLDTAPVEHFEVIGFNFYTEYQWLVDFAVWTMLVYAITEVG